VAQANLTGYSIVSALVDVLEVGAIPVEGEACLDPVVQAGLSWLALLDPAQRRPRHPATRR